MKENEKKERRMGEIRRKCKEHVLFADINANIGIITQINYIRCELEK